MVRSTFRQPNIAAVLISQRSEQLNLALSQSASTVLDMFEMEIMTLQNDFPSKMFELFEIRFDIRKPLDFQLPRIVTLYMNAI